MTNHERYPEEGDELFGRYDWEDDEIDPESEKILEELLKPLETQTDESGIKPHHIGELVHRDSVQEIQQRLDELRVEGNERIDKNWVATIPELQMTPFILDDVHYEVYRALKRGPFNRFVSVRTEDLDSGFRQLAESRRDTTNFQREQNYKAFKKLTEVGKIEEGTIYEVMKTPEGRFAVRSLTAH